MQKVHRLVNLWWVHDCRLVHVLLTLNQIHFLQLLVFLRQNKVLLKNLSILLWGQLHLVVVNNPLAGFNLLGLWVHTDFLLDELLLLL